MKDTRARPDGVSPFELNAIYPRVIACAAALAEIYFPVADEIASDGTTLTATHFILTGQFDAWPGYWSLSAAEQQLIARLHRHRHNQLAVESVFNHHAKGLFSSSQVAYYDVAGGGRLVATHGTNPLACARTLLDQLDDIRAAPFKGLVAATPGDYKAALRVPAPGSSASWTIDTRYRLETHHAPVEPVPIQITTAPALTEIDLKVADFQALAASLDAVYGQTFRGSNQLFARLQSRSGPLSGLLSMRAGKTQVLSAPTGVGKSVMLGVLGPWCVQEGITLGVVVRDNVAALELAYRIEQDCRALGFTDPGLVTPLMSPASMMEARERITATSTDRAFVQWVNFRLGYGCGLPAAAQTEQEIDAWVPGHEPCLDLVAVAPPKISSNGKGRPSQPASSACPFRGGCGKFALARSACTAKIIVTTQVNFQVGRLHIPVRFDDGPVSERETVERLLLSRCQLIAIDEIDAFQNAAIDQAGKELVLGWGGRTDGVPLNDLDRQVSEAFLRVPDSMDESTRGHLVAARSISQDYTNHLARGRFGPAAARQPSPKRSAIDEHPQWVIPQRWDGYLAILLAAYFRQDKSAIVTDPNTAGPDAHAVAVLDSLTDAKTDLSQLPKHLRALAEVLRNVTVPTVYGGGLTGARRTLDDLLSRWVKPRLRPDAVDLMLRRTYLMILRDHLYWFVNKAGQLHLAGIPAAREIAEVLGSYSAWRVAPYGPHGRLLFAFTEHVPVNKPQDTRFAVAAFGGDPHTYTVGLGQTTALAQAGCSRIVLGLSATAFMPAAHRHHLFVEPTWWVPDLDPGGVKVLAEPIPGLDDEMIRICGKNGRRRREATQILARRLAPRLRTELDTLAAAAGTSGVQETVVLATTSYDSCEDIAKGLLEAGIPAEILCVAVRPASFVPRHAGGLHRLHGDRLEEFGRLRGARILIAPLARIERALNILAPGQTRSAIGSIWMMIRPVPLIDEPAELLAHINAHALTGTDPLLLPWQELARRNREGGRYFEQIVTGYRYMSALPKRAKLALAAELIITMIQLVGRARRGGTPGVIHLVDYAFLDTRGASDLPRLIRELRAEWASTGVLPLMLDLYGATLEAFFAFADNHHRGP